MLTNEKKGITLITLIIIIVVMIILTSIFIATSMNALNETRDTEIQNEINVLEQAISEKYLSFINSNGKDSLVGEMPIWPTYVECANAIYETINFDKMQSGDVLAKKNRILNEIKRDYDSYVKIISSQEASLLGIEQFKKGDKFIVDYYTSRVFGPIE